GAVTQVVLGVGTRQHAEAVVARPPRGDLRDAERQNGDQHGIGDARVPAGARGRHAGVPGQIWTCSRSTGDITFVSALRSLSHAFAAASFLSIASAFSPR